MTPDPSNRSNGRPPTLREIADQAGVHISTASRVLRQPEPADGWSDSALRVRQVAEELGISMRMVQRHLSSIYQKTDTQTRAGLTKAFPSA